MSTLISLVVGLKSFHGFWPEHGLQAGLYSIVTGTDLC